MKKLICILVLCFSFVCTSAFAEKSFMLTEIEGLMGRIFFNQQVEEDVYYPITIQFIGKATGEGINLPIQEIITIGTPSDTPATPKELYQLIKTKFGQAIANKIKDIYMNGIAEDISN